MCRGHSILPKGFSCNLLSAGRKLMLKGISAQGKVALCFTQLATKDFQLHCHFSELIRCLCLSLCVPSPSGWACSACSTVPLGHGVWVCLLRALLQGSTRCVDATIPFTSCSAVLLCAASRGRISPRGCCILVVRNERMIYDCRVFHYKLLLRFLSYPICISAH